MSPYFRPNGLFISRAKQCDISKKGPGGPMRERIFPKRINRRRGCVLPRHQRRQWDWKKGVLSQKEGFTGDAGKGHFEIALVCREELFSRAGGRRRGRGKKNTSPVPKTPRRMGSFSLSGKRKTPFNISRDKARTFFLRST